MKRNKFLFGLALCAMVLFVNMLSAQFAGGNGTEYDPYRVATSEHLDNVRNYTDAYFIQTQDIVFTEEDFEQGGDYFNSARGWIPIGGDGITSSAFTGSYNGEGHTIENLKILGSPDDYLGLFGQTIYAKLTGIRLKNVSIAGDYLMPSNLVGALVGFALETSITRCSVEDGAISGNNYVGGLIGGASGFFLPQYYSKGTPNPEQKEKEIGIDYIASLIEKVEHYLPSQKNGIPEPENSLISGCYSDISVNGENIIGGLVGAQYLSVLEFSHSIGSVSGDEHVGGLEGASDFFVTISNCYARGDVEGEEYYGGLVGTVGYDAGYCTVEYTYSTGAISVQRSIANSGLFGFLHQSSTVIESFWDTDTSGIPNYPGGEGRTTQEMTYPYGPVSIYANWDMENNWVDDLDYLNDGYPMINYSLQKPSDFLEGNGTAGSPYLISLPTHLSNIRNYVGNKSYGMHFALVNDIDLEDYLHDSNDCLINDGKGWEPIGKSNNYFFGSLDGRGHTIKNLSIFRENESYVGLFGVTSSGTISNLRLENVDIVGHSYVGALAGSIGDNGPFYIKQTKVDSCGVVGGQVTGITWVGGLIGQFSSFYEINEKGYVINSYSNVKVQYPDIEFDTEPTVTMIGGLIGNLDAGRVVNCQSYGDVGRINGYYIHDNARSIGGLIGTIMGMPSIYSSHSSIENCFSKGSVEGYENVGGLLGETSNRAAANDKFSIIDSYSTGNVKGNYSVGGLIGSTTRTIVERCHSTGDIDGYQAVGGLIGKATKGREGESNYKKTNFVSSFSTGNVVGVSEVGGLIGLSEGKESSSAKTDISNCYSTGNVQADENVGGLVGSIIRTEVWNCYSLGEVNGSSYVGGLIGKKGSNCNITASFWNTETSGQTISAGGVGITTGEFLQEQTYYNTDWDFADTWKLINFNPYIRNTYPFLAWQETPIEENVITDGHLKILKNRYNHWECFPRLEVQDDVTYSLGLLDSATNGIIDRVTKIDTGLQVQISWDGYEWAGNLFGLRSDEGYKVHTATNDTTYLYVKGDEIPQDTELTITAGYENWLPYFVHKSQSVYDAFGDLMDDLLYIKGEGWSMTRVEHPNQMTANWIIANDDNLPFIKMHYGKMYVVKLLPSITEDIEGFQWNIPPTEEGSSKGAEANKFYLPPQTEYFTFVDEPDYESYFIEAMPNDSDILEVGVFANGECIGASLFQGGYPLEILAYPNESHFGKPISFVIHRSSKGADQQISSVMAKAPDQKQYATEVLRAGQRMFTIVNLVGNIDRSEMIVEPEFRLSQNYPNPIVLDQTSRSATLTQIDFSLPEDSKVSLDIFNIKGQLVKNLVSGKLVAGNHTISWDGRNDRELPVGSGIYFYRLDNGKKTINRKMLIVK